MSDAHEAVMYNCVRPCCWSDPVCAAAWQPEHAGWLCVIAAKNEPLAGCVLLTADNDDHHSCMYGWAVGL